MTDQTATFWGVGRFFTMHLTTKFHRPTFNRSEVIVLTNKQTDAAENIMRETQQFQEMRAAR